MDIKKAPLWIFHNFVVSLIVIAIKIIFSKEVKDLSLIASANLNEGSIHRNISRIYLIALVCAEDKRYYLHNGVDLVSVFRSIISNIIYRKPQGGSTIEQQLARTITMRKEKSVKRKIIEWCIAYNISKNYSKEMIAFCYLERAYYGWKMNGIIQACKMLGLDIEYATIDGASLVVSLLRHPMPQKPSYEKLRDIEKRKNFVAKMVRKEL